MPLSTNTQYAPDLREVINLFVPEAETQITFEFFSESGRWTGTTEICKNRYEREEAAPPFADPLEKKRLEKRFVKLCLYDALSEFYGKSMPWGALTGIRPTKLAYNEIDAGRDFRALFNKMRVSPDKTELVARVIEEQRGIRTADSAADFFVFVPFCATRCRYCSFVTADMQRYGGLVGEYVDALVKEIAAAKEFVNTPRSLYIGGGTPVALPLEAFAKMLAALGRQSVEYTIEAGRPDCINADNVRLMEKYGVTRVCVNPQTFNDATLERLGRRHTSADIYEKYALVKGRFDVNMDLIAGLEGETYDDFRRSIDKTIELYPENITVHTLCLKRGAALKEEVAYLAENGVGEMIDYAHRALGEAGYAPYYLYRQKYMAGNLENTGYARNGRKCVYNVDVMEETADVMACGANAVSKTVFGGGERIERYGSPKDVPTYLGKIDKIIADKNDFFAEKFK